MAVPNELDRLMKTKTLLHDTLVAWGVTLDPDAEFLDYVDALLNRFNDISQQLASIIGGDN